LKIEVLIKNFEIFNKSIYNLLRAKNRLILLKKFGGNAIVLNVLILFVPTYALLLLLPKFRAYIALASAVLFVVLRILPIEKIFSSVDWNVIMMIADTMGVVYLFIESKMPSLLTDNIIEKVPDVKWTIISLALFAGIISAFVDNVATVLMVAPVALTIAKKLKISPVPSIIAIAISSNLQGATTLVGDTTSIFLGSYANLDFLDFFFYRGHLGMFWIVQAGALASMLILLYVFRKENQSITNGIICMGVFVIGMIREAVKAQDIKIFLKTLKEIDYFTLLLLGGYSL